MAATAGGDHRAAGEVAALSRAARQTPCSGIMRDFEKRPMVMSEKKTRRRNGGWRMCRILRNRDFSLQLWELLLERIVQPFGTDTAAEVPVASAGLPARPERMGRSSRCREPAPAPPIPGSPRRSWMTSSASSCSRMPAAPGAVITPNSRRRTEACGYIISRKPDGRPLSQSRGSAAPTAPTRRHRREFAHRGR